MASINRTYLRYECADALSVTCDSSSCSSQIIAFLDAGENNSGSMPSRVPIVLTAAKSQCLAFHLRRGVPCGKIGHREPTNVGTGRALNSNEVTCLDTFSKNNEVYVATGWADGSIRIFTVTISEFQKASSSFAPNSASNLGLVHSLLEKDVVNEEFAMREPLVLQGHGSSPVRYLAFDKFHSGSRLTSGGSDGSVIVWDIVAETGLFRLLGHKGAITQLSFISPKGHYKAEEPDGVNDDSDVTFDGLVSSSLDGLVKIWDLDGQCCTQTLTGHRSEVWSADCVQIDPSPDDQETSRWRLVTGASDVQLRVWSLHKPRRTAKSVQQEERISRKDTKMVDEHVYDIQDSDAAVYIGSIHRQTNERVSFVKFHPSGKLLGVLEHGSKQVEVYAVRSVAESQKRRKRRLRRRREKESVQGKKGVKSEPKRGILDDDDMDEKIVEEDVGEQPNTLDDDLSQAMLKASDELELVGIVQGSHKVKSFVFAPGFERDVSMRVILVLATNALEVHSVDRTTTEG